MLSYLEKTALRLRTNWSTAIIDAIRSMSEAEIYMRAGLKEAVVGGRAALVRGDIDWADYSIPPRDRNGDPYELHHIGQRQDSPFAELTWAEHMGDGNNTVLHQAGKESEIDREAFEREKSAYWQARFAAFSKAELQAIYGR